MNNASLSLLAFLQMVNVEEAVNGDKIFLAIRIVVAVIGTALGWMLSGLLWRGLYWVFTQKGMPGLLLVPLRLVSALAVGAAIFLFLPVGFGGFGGLGSGGGQGNGTGEGKGTGPDQGTGTNNSNSGDGKSKNNSSENKSVDRIDILLLGGADYKGEGKYYKVRVSGKEDFSVLTLEEVGKLLDARKGSVNVLLKISGQSIKGVPREDLIQKIRSRSNIEFDIEYLNKKNAGEPASK